MSDIEGPVRLVGSKALKRAWTQRSTMTPRELCEMQLLMGLTNRQLAIEIGISEVAVSHYRTGGAFIPLVVERAMCFLALKRALLVHDIVVESRTVGRVDFRAFLARFRSSGHGIN